MSLLIQCTIFLLVMVHSAISATTLDPVSIPGNGETGTCPTQESRDSVIQNISASVQMIVQHNLAISTDCGSGEWYRIAHLNMSDSSQQCPSAWSEFNNVTEGVRGCRRPDNSLIPSCPVTFYPTNRQYSRVCGRVIGYQYGTTEAFEARANGRDLDSFYVYGVSVTHGAAPRNHIWTLAAGLSEGAAEHYDGDCPCIDPGNRFPPSFVGNNYYCESGNPTNTVSGYHLYSTDPLWDGQQCEGECCSNGKSPPWFSVELPNPTTDDIEVRLCIPEFSGDGVIIQLLELYVQ